VLTKFGHITITVRDYDEALDFYVGKLGFALIADRRLAPGIRWVSVAPRPGSETTVVFEQAQTAEDRARLGKQFPGMTLTLFSDDLDTTVAALAAAGVTIVEPVRTAPWGKQAVIADLYGNLFDLLQPPAPQGS
jgi:catechol 2,3-dioxygenase-like lactoylglutathione lyase family enzyme